MPDARSARLKRNTPKAPGKDRSVSESVGNSHPLNMAGPGTVNEYRPMSAAIPNAYSSGLIIHVVIDLPHFLSFRQKYASFDRFPHETNRMMDPIFVSIQQR